MEAIRGGLSLCHGFQDLDVIVKSLGYVPVVDPQWDRGRIAFNVNRNHECTENGKENAQKTVTTVHKNQ